jgi:hypothetical protein
MKFTFNQTTLLYPVFDTNYESEVIFFDSGEYKKYRSQLWTRMSENDYHLLTFVARPNFCYQNFKNLSYTLNDAELQELSQNIKVILGQHGSE